MEGDGGAGTETEKSAETRQVYKYFLRRDGHQKKHPGSLEALHGAASGSVPGARRLPPGGPDPGSPNILDFAMARSRWR